VGRFIFDDYKPDLALNINRNRERTMFKTNVSLMQQRKLEWWFRVNDADGSVQKIDKLLISI